MSLQGEEVFPLEELVTESDTDEAGLKDGVQPTDKSDEPSQKKEVLIPDCPVHSVVVYPDRAEVSSYGPGY